MRSAKMGRGTKKAASRGARKTENSLRYCCMMRTGCVWNMRNVRACDDGGKLMTRVEGNVRREM